MKIIYLMVDKWLFWWGLEDNNNKLFFSLPENFSLPLLDFYNLNKKALVKNIQQNQTWVSAFILSEILPDEKEERNYLFES